MYHFGYARMVLGCRKGLIDDFGGSAMLVGIYTIPARLSPLLILHKRGVACGGFAMKSLLLLLLEARDLSAKCIHRSGKGVAPYFTE